jgi:hypothetical protein
MSDVSEQDALDVSEQDVVCFRFRTYAVVQRRGVLTQ